MRTVNLLDEDLLLWNRFRDGDADAFGALMRIHYADLFHYGSSIVKEKELVKDCIQDLFLALWENREGISSTSFVKYYLLKSLRRKLIRTIERNRYFTVPDHSYFESFFKKNSDGENDIIKQQNQSALALKMRSVLADLPSRQQEVIYFRFFMDADIDEIADIMEMNTQSVYNLLHRSLKKLKKIADQKQFTFSQFFLGL